MRCPNCGDDILTEVYPTVGTMGGVIFCDRTCADTYYQTDSTKETDMNTPTWSHFDPEEYDFNTEQRIVEWATACPGQQYDDTKVYVVLRAWHVKDRKQYMARLSREALITRSGGYTIRETRIGRGESATVDTRSVNRYSKASLLTFAEQARASVEHMAYMDNMRTWDLLEGRNHYTHNYWADGR